MHHGHDLRQIRNLAAAMVMLPLGAGRVKFAPLGRWRRLGEGVVRWVADGFSASRV